MDINRLKSFFTVASTGSFTEAAEQLYVTQSTVSKHIIALEKELGIQLLNRYGKSFTLTEEGKKMLRYYSEMLEIYDKSQIALEEIKNQTKNRSELCIVGEDRMSHYGVINSLMSFIQDQPDIKLNIDDTGRKNMIFALRSGAYELAFCQENLLDAKYFSWQYYYRDQYMAAVSTDSQLASKKFLFLSDLKEKKIILGSCENEFCKKNEIKERFHWDVVFETDDPAIAMEFLISTRDCIYIAPGAVMSRYPGKLTTQIPIKGMGECVYVLAWKKREKLSQCAKDYLHYLRERKAEDFIKASLDRKLSGK